MWSIGSLLIWVIVLVGIVAIAWIALKAMGVEIPVWVRNILWVVLVVIVAVFAIRVLMNLLGLP